MFLVEDAKQKQKLLAYNCSLHLPIYIQIGTMHQGSKTTKISEECRGHESNASNRSLDIDHAACFGVMSWVADGTGDTELLGLTGPSTVELGSRTRIENNHCQLQRIGFLGSGVVVGLL